MEVRVYIPVKNTVADAVAVPKNYQRTEGGFWYTETINETRRTFQVRERFFVEASKKYIVEFLEEEAPDYVSLPCWQLPSNNWSETRLSEKAVVEHFPEFNVVRFSPELIDTLEKWLVDIPMDELKKKVSSFYI